MSMNSVDRVADAFITSPQVRHAEFTKHRLGVGDFQTTKSRVAIELCWRSIFHNHRAPILLLRNIDADFQQMSNRIKRINRDIAATYGVSWVLPMPKRLIDMRDDEIAYSIEIERAGMLLIGLCNAQTIGRLNKIILARPELDKRFNLVIDEGDLFTFDMHTSEAKREEYLNTRTKTEKELEMLYRFSNSMHTITGTGLPVYCSRDLEAVYHLTPVPPTPQHVYYGFEQLTHIPMPTKRRKGRGYHYPSDREALDRVMRIFLNDDDSRLLINPGPLKADHEQVVNFIRLNHAKDNITIIVHNDIEIKVYLPPNHPAHTTRAYYSPSMVVKATGRDARTISEVLQELKDERDKEIWRHSHILIIAGNKAGRGISFVSEDYQWHLTHLYMVVSPSKHTEGLLQAAARLCGMYADDRELKLMLDKSVYDDLMHDRALLFSFGEAFRQYEAGNLNDLRNLLDYENLADDQRLEDRVRVIAPGMYSLLGRPSSRGLTAKRKNVERYDTLEFADIADNKHYNISVIPTVEDGWSTAPNAVLLDRYIKLDQHLDDQQRKLLIHNLPFSPDSREGDWEAIDAHLETLIAADLAMLRKHHPALTIPDVLSWRLPTSTGERYKIRWDQHKPRKLRDVIIRHELHLSKVRNFGAADTKKQYRRPEYFESHAFMAVSRDLNKIGLVYRLVDWDTIIADGDNRMVKWRDEPKYRKSGEERRNTINRLKGPFICHDGRGRLGLFLEPQDSRVRTRLVVLPETAAAA